jgi:uncharacterized Fe-S cluster-containing MiaB family protein
MEFENFERAKKLNEQIVRLEHRKRKLEESMKSNCLSVTVFYTAGPFLGDDEVRLQNTDNIKEMILREIRDTSIEIESLKEEFESI